MVQPLLHENSDEGGCQAKEQAREPESFTQTSMVAGTKSDGGIEGRRGDGVDRGSVGDGTLNEDRFVD